MTTSIVPFQYESFTIRTVVDESGETLWVAKDVAEVLGYKDTTKAISQHCRGGAKHHPIVDALGRTQQVRVIHEPDLYRLITNSQLEGAVRFEVWVFEEVLPAIRKTGRYSSSSMLEPRATAVHAEREFKALHSIATIAGLVGNQAIIAASDATARLTGQNPLALIGATHLVAEVQTARHLTATELGERMGISAQAFNRLLVSHGLQCCVGTGVKKFWQPTEAGRKYAVLIDTGKRHTEGSMVQQLRWLESVVEFLRNADGF